MAHTCTHNVISEKWSPKPEGQHEQVAGQAGEQLVEACCIGTKIGKPSCHQHPMGMKANNIVLPGIQVSCLHQLGEEKKRSDHLIIPKEQAAKQTRTLIFNSIFDPFKYISNLVSKSRVQSIWNHPTLMAIYFGAHAGIAHF